MGRALIATDYPTLTYFLCCYAAVYTESLEENVRGFKQAEGAVAAARVYSELRKVLAVGFSDLVLEEYLTQCDWRYQIQDIEYYRTLAPYTVEQMKDAFFKRTAPPFVTMQFQNLERLFEQAVKSR